MTSVFVDTGDCQRGVSLQHYLYNRTLKRNVVFLHYYGADVSV